VLTSNKTVVLQIDKTKFNEQVEYFKKMNWLSLFLLK
jgi:hypothetical protein